MMQLVFTEHAQRVMAELRILPKWVEQAVDAPQRRTLDPYDGTVERFYARIPENGDRVLRVAVNTGLDPRRVVTAFFDRSMKGMK